MRFVLTRDVNEFAKRTHGLLNSRIECHVQASVFQDVLAGRYRTALFAYGLDERGGVGFAALRTAPWFMLASRLESAAPGLVKLWLEEDPELPGVNSVPATARAIASSWSAQTGGTTRCRAHEAIHLLGRVREPARPAPGRLRLPHEDERPLLVEWMRAFAIENGTIPVEEAEAMVDVPLARDGLMVWDAEGPVSMTVFSASLAGTVRIGPVYTPPEHRRRGYATTMVAAVSRAALNDGADRCMLYTDLANPTSNKIYAEVGYRRIADWEEHAFQVASR